AATVALPLHDALPISRRLTLRTFDDLYTAPQGGFADAGDYYRRSSSLPLIPRIPVPTLIVTARDDPFVAAEPFERIQAPAHVDRSEEHTSELQSPDHL